MPRADLIARLTALQAPTWASCFALIWTYFDQSGVTQAENLMRKRRIHPARLQEFRPRTNSAGASHAAAIAKLRGLTDGAEHDLLALQWLKYLDVSLKESSTETFEEAEFVGADGKLYRVRRRNCFLADLFESHGLAVTGERDQSRSVTTYSPHHKAVPVDPVGDIEVECQTLKQWGSAYLHDRLRKERDHFQVLLWPFETIIDYHALDSLEQKPPPEFLNFSTVRNEEALQREIVQALASARDHQATLLVFPELSIPPSLEEEIVRLLRDDHGLDSYPILTVFGCCHRPLPPEGASYVNEAVLLGPDGTVLHRHRKLAAYTSFHLLPDEEVGTEPATSRFPQFAEPLAVGSSLTVLQSDLGNLTLLICLDLFNHQVQKALYPSHANLLVVPSLSDKVSAHRRAAVEIMVKNRASIFVCNRHLRRYGSEATSFYQLPLPHPRGYKAHWHEGQTPAHPYLRFSLAKSLSEDELDDQA